MGDIADYGTIEPVTPAEARHCAGTERLTREHVEASRPLTDDGVRHPAHAA